MKSAKPEEIESALRDILRMNYHLEGRGIAKLGITVGQCHLLFLIKERESMTMSELAAAIGVTTGAATGFISRLLGRKLVSRYHDTEDRRRVMVKLTSKGEAVMAEILKLKRKRLDGVLSVITAAEQQAFSEIINKIYNYLKRETEQLGGKK